MTLNKMWLFKILKKEIHVGGRQTCCNTRQNTNEVYGKCTERAEKAGINSTEEDFKRRWHLIWVGGQMKFQKAETGILSWGNSN